MRLYHFIGGTEVVSEEIVSEVLREGLKANFGGWTDIDRLLPHRPKGIFFWGEDNEKAARLELSNRVVVLSEDLDTSKLWAFPAEASEVANLAICGYELVPEAYEFMAEAKPLPFSEWLETQPWPAEFIYEGDISPEKIR